MNAPDSYSAGQIKAARALLDWTQADLARATGFTSRNIGNLENGRGRELFEPKYIAHFGDIDRQVTGTIIQELEVWTFP